MMHMFVVPTEQEPNLRDFMIVLRPQASFEEINTIIYRALEDPLELQRKALAAFAYAREYLTNTRKVDNVIRDVIAYKAVSRHTVYPTFRIAELGICCFRAKEVIT